MGSTISCDNYPKPCPNDLCNQCNVDVGDTYLMPAFCGIPPPLFSHDPSVFDQYCQKMSSAGEWGNAKKGDSCMSYDGYQEIPGYGPNDCCQGDPQICLRPGNQLICERLKYAGDPGLCCLSDYNCNTINNNACFSDGAEQQKTCDPRYRDMGAETCRDPLFAYCSGADVTGQEWLNRWNQGPKSCFQALKRQLFNLTPPNSCNLTPPPRNICNIPINLPVSSEGLYWGQQLLATVIKRYQEEGYILGSLPGSSQYNIFQELLYQEICCPYPALCDRLLDEACQNYDMEHISRSYTLSNWCGCHLNNEQYEEYSQKFGISPLCTPVCNRADVIPKIGPNLKPAVCPDNICIIDNVTANIVNTQVGGDINFNQICGNCRGQECSCMVSDVTVDIVGGTIGGNVIPVLDQCGTFTCNKINTSQFGPRVITVPCNEQDAQPFTIAQLFWESLQLLNEQNNYFWNLLIIILVLFTIFLIIFVLGTSQFSW